MTAAYSAYDTDTERLYAVGRGNGGYWVINEYNPATDVWIAHGVAAPAANSAVGVSFDPARGRFLVFSGEYPISDKLWAYDVSAKSWSDISPAGTKPPGGPNYGLAVDTRSDKYLAIRNGAVWVFDPSATAWAQGSGVLPNMAQVNGRLVYDPVRDVTLVVYRNGTGPLDTWAYKMEQL